MKPIVEQYFKAFANKDLETLSTLYDDNVVLWEWGENIFMGKEQVLAANKSLFDIENELRVMVQRSAEVDEYASFHELMIHVSDNRMVTVVDVITVFENKITNVTAYRGFMP